MLSAIRRLVHSKVGLFVTFAFLAIIGLAFAATDITGLSSSGAPLAGDSVATIGKQKITPTELRTAAQDRLEGYRQQQPTLDMVQFANGGGVEATLNGMIEGYALEQFGHAQGIVVSKRAVDGQISSVPSLQGTDGTFSQLLYNRLLQERRITDAQVRADLTRQIITRQLILPTIGTSQIPVQLALPYASLQLEKRVGQIGFVPTAAMPQGAAPTNAEITNWYRRNVARYTIPERRVVRYAMVTSDQVKAQTTPTEAELQAAYKSQSATYAPTEKRSFAQVTVRDEATGNALVAKIKAGTKLEDAARQAQLDPLIITRMTKAAYLAQSSPTAADAIFGAARGAIVGPVRGVIGFTVARIDGIEQVAGKSFAQARPELLAAVTRDKTTQVLSRIHDAIDDALGKNATFDEIVADQKLTASTTPALLSDGRDPDDATKKAAPDFAPALAAAFAAQPGDAPQMVQVDPAGGFALVGLGRVVAPAAPPLAQLRPVLARDVLLDRARRQARVIAAGIVAGASKSGAFAALYAAAGVKTPPIQPLTASRAQLAQNPRGAPPPLVLLFSMAQGSTKLLEAPDNGGWFVIHLDRIDRGNAAGQKALIDRMRADMGQLIGRELAEQFTNAVQNQIGVKRNDKAVAALKAELTGQAAQP